MIFGKIDNFILFGGGQRLVNFITAANGYRIFVLSAPRLLSSRLDHEDITVEGYFQREDIPYASVETLDEFDSDVYINEHTLGISFGAPWIFRKKFIAKFQGRLINGHGTQLPKNRGGATFSWQIMRGDRSGAYLFHLIDEGIDTGNIITKRTFEFPTSCRTPKDFRDFYIYGEHAFFEEFLTKLAAGEEFEEVIQDESQSTYFPRLSTRHQGCINWQWSAQEIERFICAFDEPYEGASTFFDGTRVFLKGASVQYEEGTFHPAMSGLIYRKYGSKVYVAVRDGSIVIDSVADENGSCIFDHIRTGERFFTPSNVLDAAYTFKAVYDARGLKS